MTITMQPGVEVTTEIQDLAEQYDFYTLYIDSYTQMIQAQDRNQIIMERLTDLGVERIQCD